MANHIDLSIDFCGVKFKNPFLLSSSPVSNSAEMVARSFDAGWSGVVFKTLNSDRLPIYEPGLAELVRRNAADGHIEIDDYDGRDGHFRGLRSVR